MIAPIKTVAAAPPTTAPMRQRMVAAAEPSPAPADKVSLSAHRQRLTNSRVIAFVRGDGMTKRDARWALAGMVAVGVAGAVIGYRVGALTSVGFQAHAVIGGGLLGGAAGMLAGHYGGTALSRSVR